MSSPACWFEKYSIILFYFILFYFILFYFILLKEEMFRMRLVFLC